MYLPPCLVALDCVLHQSASVPLDEQLLHGDRRSEGPEFGQPLKEHHVSERRKNIN